MLEPFSASFLVWFASAAVILIIIAGAILLIVPSWIVALRPEREPSRLEAEDTYRKALAQIIGFPLALIGAAGVYIGAFQALATYQRSQEVAYQDQYQNGFKALGSNTIATRIGGLYTLQGLIERTGDTSAGTGLSDRERDCNAVPNAGASGQERNLTLLRALAAFAVEQPAKADEIVHPDALTALQILAFRKAQINVRFDLRTGKFPGSVLADDPTKRCADFRKFDLYNTDFSGSDLYRAQLYEANLRKANLNGSNLTNAILTRAGLSGTTFCPSLNLAVPALMHAYPVRAQLSGTAFYSSFGEDTRFDGAQMAGAILNDSNLILPSFVNRILYNARFLNATLDRPDFTEANLKDASFEGATLNKPILKNALLINTNLHAKGISDEDLQGAHLCNVIGPSGQRLPGDCDDAMIVEKAEEERMRSQPHASPFKVNGCQPPAP
jgi:uncharacterized protein YjbI with pentapeptide repeats